MKMELDVVTIFFGKFASSVYNRPTPSTMAHQVQWNFIGIFPMCSILFDKQLILFMLQFFYNWRGLINRQSLYKLF